MDKKEIAEEIKKLLLEENKIKAIVLVREKLGLGLKEALEIVNEVQMECFPNQMIREEDMGMNAEIIAIGIFKEDIIPYLEYPENCYSSVREGIKITSFICEASTTSRSYLLAECLGIDPWDFNQHEINPLNMNIERMKTEFGDDVVDRINALHHAGFSFFYRPNG